MRLEDTNVPPHWKKLSPPGLKTEVIYLFEFIEYVMVTSNNQSADYLIMA